MHLLTQNQAKELDNLSSSDYDISSDSLMKNAGKEAANFIISKFENMEPQKVAIVCGKGNNGGDGFATALHLNKSNHNVVIFSIFKSEFLSSSSSAFHDQCIDNKIEIFYDANPKDIESKFDIIVDAILGIGFSGELKDNLAPWIEWINKGDTIISLDIPTGVNGDTGTIASHIVNANITITMGKIKVGMLIQPGRAFCGDIYPVDIGFPSIIDKLNGRKWRQITEGDIKSKVIPLKADTHKYQQGKVLILAGSVGMTGAAYLSTMGALRSGVGLTMTCAPSSLNNIYEQKITEGMTLVCEDGGKGYFSKNNYDLIMENVEWCDAFIIGPGLGVYDEVFQLVNKLVKNVEKPMVIDADGLRVFNNNLNLFKEINSNTVITPHLGELSRLVDMKSEIVLNNLIDVIDNFMNDYSGVLMAKFSPSLVASNLKGYVNSTGNAGLATAGSGDVLTGIIASLIAQGYALDDAALIAMFVHGKAADQLAKSISQRGMIASDLLYKIGRIFSDYEL